MVARSDQDYGVSQPSITLFLSEFLKENLARSYQKCSSISKILSFFGMICVEMKIQPFNLSFENNLCLAN